MSRKLRFIWIDDNPKRKSSANTLQDRLGVTVEFRNAYNQDLLSLLHSITEQEEPDLILMDHWFTEADSHPFVGSTAAEHLRETWPECLIVCVTAAGPEKVGSHKSDLYELVIEIEKISNYDKILISIAQSFRTLRKKPPETTKQLIKYLRAPKDDYQSLEAVIPDAIKISYGDKGCLLFISKWVRNTLMKRPGFLYDRLWAATLLGIQEKSFHRVEHLFDKAKYSGIFAHEGEGFWWQSKLRSILSFLIRNDLVKSDKVLLPWEMGRLLHNITPKDHSKCYLSNEAFPETVAYIDETATKRAPMRLRYTVRHPRFEDALFFEEIRMMKGRA